VDEENVERFCIINCATCDQDIDEDSHEIVFVWGEPMGQDSKFVALHVYCKETCVQDAISAYTDKIQKDIILCWVSMPGVELQGGSST
jgi:hypothetical protein